MSSSESFDDMAPLGGVGLGLLGDELVHHLNGDTDLAHGLAFLPRAFIGCEWSAHIHVQISHVSRSRLHILTPFAPECSLLPCLPCIFLLACASHACDIQDHGVHQLTLAIQPEAAFLLPGISSITPIITISCMREARALPLHVPCGAGRISNRKSYRRSPFRC